MIDLNLNPSKKELRTFGLLSLAFSAIVALLVWRRTASAPAAAAIVIAGGLAAVLGLAAPRILRPVFIVLMVVSFPIGWVISHLLMAFIFYFVVTPLGVIMRLTGRDPMARMFDRGAKTYWIPRRRTESKADRYFRQF